MKNRRKIIEAPRQPELQKTKELSNKHLAKKGTRIQKLGNRPTTKNNNFVIMPGSGAQSYTNYKMNPKSNPYLAPSNAQILGFTLQSKHTAKQGGPICFRPPKNR